MVNYCNKCGSDKLIRRGFSYTTAGKYQRMVCTKCGAWFKDGNNLLTKEERKLRVRNIL